MTVTEPNSPLAIKVDHNGFDPNQEAETSPDSTRRDETTSDVMDNDAPAIGAPPDVLKMKKRRKKETVAAGVLCGVAGTVLLGPIVGLAAAILGAVGTKKKLKKKEREALDTYQKELAEVLSPTPVSTEPAVPVHARTLVLA